MDFNRRIYELNRQKLNYINLNKGIEREKEKQIAELRKKLDDEYKEKIDFNQQKIDEILNEELKIYKSIEYYSLFNYEDISKILISIISVFSNKEFVYTTIPVYKDSNLQISKPVRILINKKYIQEYFLAKSIADLINKGKAIILDENGNGIFFYKYNKEKNTIISNINLISFPYLKEFIDYIISYKIDRQISKVSYDNLDILKFKFISSKTNELKTSYEIGKALENYSKNKKSEIPKIKRTK